TRSSGRWLANWAAHENPRHLRKPPGRFVEHGARPRGGRAVDRCHRSRRLRWSDGRSAVQSRPGRCGSVAGRVAFRRRLDCADAVLISSLEYAHGVAGVLKNALDWVVGSGELMTSRSDW